LADQTKERAPDAETADNPDNQGPQTVMQRPPKRHSSTFFAIITILSVLALAAAGYFFVQQLREKQEGLGGRLSEENQQVFQMTKQITSLQSQLATLQSQLATIQSKVTTSESKYERALSVVSDTQAGKLEQLRSEHEQKIYRLQRQLAKTRGDWLIADAEYLLSVANQRLQLVGDVKTTRLALEAADQRLRESGDPGVFKVREAIAHELSVLKEVNPPDVVGIFSRLRNLENRTRDLPVFLPHAGKVKKAGQGEAADEPEQSESVIDSAIEDLKDLIEIRRVDRPIEAVLMPEEVALIRQDLRLDFEMARLALLQHDETLYKANLENARDWLKQHFDTKDPATKKVLAEIDELMKTPVSVQYPDIGQSLILLRQMAKLRLETDKALLDEKPAQEAKEKPAPEEKKPRAPVGEKNPRPEEKKQAAPKGKEKPGEHVHGEQQP
jgi:uroporphyrinogen III methyltransferase / synthase